MTEVEGFFAIDARGLRCPWPVLRLAREMRAHDRIRITVDDPAAPGELRGIAEARGWRLRPIEGEANCFAVCRD